MSSCFSESLATKCLPLNGEPCTIRPTGTDLDHVELKYYPFMIGFDKCTDSCNVSSRKTCVAKETEDINIKAFNMIRNKKEA